MSDALNAACFGDARWLNGARGADRLASGWPEYNGGILMPKPVHLRLGQKYFRFANSKSDREHSQLGGPWWVEFETLKEIANHARRFSTPRDAVRYLLAVPWEWSEIDKLVCAILEQPLDAYRGKGKPVQTKAANQAGAHPNDRATVYIPPQHLEIMQLYIPGLYDPISRSDEIRRKAFPKAETEDIWTSPHFH